MKTPMSEIVGNEHLRRRLCDDVLCGTMSHAYILAGPRGSGKHRIAMHYAAASACENKSRSDQPLPCLNCPSCRKILEEKSPDVILVKKDKLSIKIDQIRELQNDVRKVPVDLDHKFYIIEDAETMTEDAQNAFLQTLEEPPTYVHFFLLCENIGPLLETVRSRAPVLRTTPIPRSELREYLFRICPEAKTLAATDENALEEILTIADGAIGRAVELVDQTAREPQLERRRLAANLVENALGRRVVPLVDMIYSLPQKQDELVPILSLACSALRDLITLKQAENAPLCFYTDRSVATETAYSHSLSALLSLYDNFTNAADLLTKNIHPKLTLTALLAQL